MMAVFQKYFIGRNFDRISTNISDCALPTPSPNHPLRSNNYTHPYQPLTIPGSPSQWITCLAYHPQSMAMTAFLWLLISSLKWPFWQLARRILWLRRWPSSSLSMYGFIFGSHRQLFLIGIAGFSVHLGPSYGQCWTPSSPNPLPSIPKPMVRQRWSIRWSCTSYRCTTPNIHAHGMTTFLMCNTATIELFTALLDTTHFK